MKRIISILLALAMLFSLAACAGGKAQPDGSGGLPDLADAGQGGETAAQPITTSGRYVERKLTLEELESLTDATETITGLYAFADHTLDLLGNYWQEGEGCTGFWYHSDDQGDSWERRTIPEEWVDPGHLFLARDGGLYAVSALKEDGTQTIYYRSPEGENHTAEISGPCGNLRFLDQGIYVYDVSEGDPSNGSTTIKAVDARTGEPLWEHQEKTVYLQWNASETQVYLTDGAAVKLILDAATGEKVGELETDLLLTGLDGMLWLDDQVYYYLDESSGSLCRGIFGSQTNEIVLSADEYNYATQMGGTFFQAAFAKSENLVLYLNAADITAERERICLYRFSFDENAALPDTTLTVWSLEEKNTIRQAILFFREAHPEVQVDYQVQAVEGAAELNDVLTALNTKVLAGEGPDVLLLDGTNYESYVEKGVLSDLTGLYQDIQFVGAIAEPFLEAGSCYVIPARFTVPVLLSDGAGLAGDLPELTQAVTSAGAGRQSEWRTVAEGAAAEYDSGNPPYLDVEIGALYDLLWNTSAPMLVKESGVEEANLRQWLQTVKETGEYYGLLANGIDPSRFYGGSGGGSYGNQEVYVSQASGQWEQGYALTGAEQLDSIECLVDLLEQYSYNVNGAAEAFQLAQFPGLLQGAYTPELLLAVSAASRQQELAEEFVRTVLSMDVQQYTYGDGLPVLQAAVDRQLEYFAPDAEQYGWELRELQDLFDSRTTPVVTDQTVYDVVYQAADGYCRGELTLDEAVEQSKAGLALKLAEQ